MQQPLVRQTRFRLGRTVRARIGCTEVNSTFRVVKYSLPPSHRCGIFPANSQQMSFLSKLLQYVRSDARLHKDVATNGARARIRDRESRGVQRGLDVHPIVDEIGDELGVSQWLVRAAHDAEPDVNVSAFHERRNNSVERALARG